MLWIVLSCNPQYKNWENLLLFTGSKKLLLNGNVFLEHQIPHWLRIIFKNYVIKYILQFFLGDLSCSAGQEDFLSLNVNALHFSKSNAFHCYVNFFSIFTFHDFCSLGRLHWLWMCILISEISPVYFVPALVISFGWLRWKGR